METSETEQQATTERIVHRGSHGKPWLVSALVILCVVVSWVGVIDQKSKVYVKESVDLAIVAYAGARTLNAGISVIQSAEFGTNFFVDASMQPFQFLDPIDDMVEDYATAMKYAIGSLMIQRLLVDMLSTDTFKWLMMGAAAFLLSSMLLLNGLYSGMLFKVFIFLSSVRFLFVIAIFLSGIISDAFITKDATKEIEKIGETGQLVKSLDAGSVDLSVPESSAINQQTKELIDRRDKLSTEIKEQRNLVSSTGEVLRSKKSERDKINDSFGFLRKYSPFKFDENYTKADQAVQEAESVFNKTAENLEEKEDILSSINDKIIDLYNQQSGKRGLLLASKDKLSALKELANIDSIKQKLDGIIESMLQVIALFVFKTLVMPLVFLFIVLHVFKALWGIDPRSLTRESYAEIKGDK